MAAKSAPKGLRWPGLLGGDRAIPLQWPRRFLRLFGRDFGHHQDVLEMISPLDDVFIWTFTKHLPVPGWNRPRHCTFKQPRLSPVCPLDPAERQESDEVQRAAAELLRSEKKLMKTALESELGTYLHKKTQKNLTV